MTTASSTGCAQRRLGVVLEAAQHQRRQLLRRERSVAHVARAARCPCRASRPGPCASGCVVGARARRRADQQLAAVEHADRARRQVGAHRVRQDDRPVVAHDRDQRESGAEIDPDDQGSSLFVSTLLHAAAQLPAREEHAVQEAGIGRLRRLLAQHLPDRCHPAPALVAVMREQRVHQGLDVGADQLTAARPPGPHRSSLACARPPTSSCGLKADLETGSVAGGGCPRWADRSGRSG